MYEGSCIYPIPPLWVSNPFCMAGLKSVFLHLDHLPYHGKRYQSILLFTQRKTHAFPKSNKPSWLGL